MPGAHAKLAPSASARWIPCTGSVAASEGLPPEPSSEYAAEGSVAHEVAAYCLKNDTQAADQVGNVMESDGFTFTVDEEMAEFVQVYVDKVRTRKGEKMIEELLDLREVYGVDLQFGTGDSITMDVEAKQIIVDDLKFGRGIVVYAKDNPQMYSYGAGAFVLLDMLGDWETIKVAIHQPRCGHYDEHVITVQELKEWMSDAQKSAREAIDLIGRSDEEIAAHFVAGPKQCQWCPLKGTCPAAADFAHATIFEGFTDVTQDTPMTTKNPTKLEPEALAVILERLAMIGKWCEAVAEEGLRRVTSDGESVPRHKLVHGKKGARKFEDKAEAEKLLKAARLKVDEMYSRTLMTPTMLGKSLKKRVKLWNKLLPLIVQPDGKPTLAHETDKREAVVTAAVFEDVTEPDYGDLI